MEFEALHRRTFLKSSLAAGAWLLSVSIPLRMRSSGIVSAQGADWQVYVRIHSDNTVTMVSPVMEAGQFMRTTGPMMIAEEMDLDWDLIRFTEDAPAHFARGEDGSFSYRYAKINTGGSFSVQWTWDYLRTAGAVARRMLLEEAAERLAVPIAKLRTAKGIVYYDEKNVAISYGELGERAARRKVNVEGVALKERSQYKIIGSEKRNIDLYNIITGEPLYGIDATYPDCLQVVIDRAPAIGAEIVSYDRAAAMEVEGVRDVVEVDRLEGEHSWNGQVQYVSAGVAVLADSLWSALKGKRALETKWKNESRFANEDSEKQQQLFREHLEDETFPLEVTQDFGDVDLAVAEAEVRLEQIYEKPLYAHALMEPFNCIVDLRSESATVITGHQHPLLIAQDVEAFTGISALNTEIVCKRMGGAFGRRYQQDWIREALLLAKKVKKPIKVTWMREDELERGFHDPAMAGKVTATLKSGKITSWRYKQSQTNGGIQDNSFPQGLVENFRVERCRYNSNVPIGPWRGPMHPMWCFATESMLDELAYASGADPFAFRMDLFLPEREFPFTNWGAEVKNSGRLARCYEAVARMSEWTRKRPAGTGLGIAGHLTHGSYAAFVLEVTVEGDRLRLNEAWGAIDCGLPINPNHIRAQMEGGFIDGLNAALYNKVVVKGGAVLSNQFDKLYWGRMKDFPVAVHTEILESGYKPTGVGEPPTAPAAAALVNAIYAACGRRIREQPVNKIFQMGEI